MCALGKFKQQVTCVVSSPDYDSSFLCFDEFRSRHQFFVLLGPQPHTALGEKFFLQFFENCNYENDPEAYLATIALTFEVCTSKCSTLNIRLQFHGVI